MPVVFKLLVTGLANVTDVWFHRGLAVVSSFMLLVTRLAVVTVSDMSQRSVSTRGWLVAALEVLGHQHNWIAASCSDFGSRVHHKN